MDNLKVVKQLIADTRYKNGRKNAKKYITVHMTDSWGRGAGAQAHAKLQARPNPRPASWHWQVDSVEAIQSFTHDFQLWHAGHGTGNNQSIGIEICVNSDGHYPTSVENGARLTARIAKEEGIPVSNIVQHNHWTGKNCPSDLRRGRDGITWSDFIEKVKTYLADKPAPEAPQPTTTAFVVGGKVSIKDSAKNYSRSTKAIGDQYKGKPYTIQQIGNDDVLLKELYSWVKKEDTTGQDAAPAPEKPKTYKVGDRVTVKKTAKTYATGQNIASFVKGSTYRIIQVKPDRVLLSDIISWVRISDLV